MGIMYTSTYHYFQLIFRYLLFIWSSVYIFLLYNGGSSHGWTSISKLGFNWNIKRLMKGKNTRQGNVYLFIYIFNAHSLQELPSWEWPQQISTYPWPYMPPSHIPFYAFLHHFSPSYILPHVTGRIPSTPTPLVILSSTLLVNSIWTDVTLIFISILSIVLHSCVTNVFWLFLSTCVCAFLDVHSMTIHFWTDNNLT